MYFRKSINYEGIYLARAPPMINITVRVVVQYTCTFVLYESTFESTCVAV